MTTHRASKRLALGVVAALASIGGCARPAPSADAVLWYLRIVQANGQVRRVWPEGQAYLNAITRQNAVLRRELRALEGVTTPAALWPVGDPRWQDRAALAAAIEELDPLVAADGEHAKTRAEALAALESAIAQTPAGLELSGAAAKDVFVADVWAALAIDGAPLGERIAERVAVAQARLALTRAVLASAEAFDATRTGLAVSDPARQAELEAQYAALATQISTRTALLDAAAEAYAENRAALAQVDKAAERGRYEYLDARKTYLRNQLEAVTKAAEAELADVQAALEASQKPEGDAAQAAGAGQATAYYDQRAAELRAELEATRARVQAVLKPAPAAALRERPRPGHGTPASAARAGKEIKMIKIVRRGVDHLGIWGSWETCWLLS